MTETDQPTRADTTACDNCRHPGADRRICARCRTRAAEWLDALPPLHARIPLALVRTRTTGERVSGGGRSAPLPLATDALNLVADGRIDLTGQAPAGDQIGQLPLAVWLADWADEWRWRFGHDPGRFARAAPMAGPNPRMAARLLDAAARQRVELPDPDDPDGDPVVEWRPRPHPIDTVDAELRARFGASSPDRRIGQNCAYLAATLEWACEQHPEIVEFLAQLRAITGACRAAVGERSDLEYLGRCPEMFRDRATGGQEPCGAHLVQDPYVKVIVCPRCKTETRERQWLWLARRIRDTWGEVGDREAWQAAS